MHCSVTESLKHYDPDAESAPKIEPEYSLDEYYDQLSAQVEQFEEAAEFDREQHRKAALITAPRGSSVDAVNRMLSMTGCAPLTAQEIEKRGFKYE